MRPTVVHIVVLIQCVVYVMTFGERRAVLPCRRRRCPAIMLLEILIDIIRVITDRFCSCSWNSDWFWNYPGLTAAAASSTRVQPKGAKYMHKVHMQRTCTTHRNKTQIQTPAQGHLIVLQKWAARNIGWSFWGKYVNLEKLCYTLWVEHTLSMYNMNPRSYWCNRSPFSCVV